MMLDGTGYVTVGPFSNALFGDLGVERFKEERRGLRGKKKRLLADGG
jgi:hypothetical protein